MIDVITHAVKRTYESAVRAGAKQDTRDRILDAMVDVVTRQGVHAFSVQNVANAAGVSHRTVYRHFATREALLEGLDELMERRAQQTGIVLPSLTDIVGLPSQVETGFRSFDVMRDAMRAYVMISVALGRRVPSFDRRTRAIEDAIAGAFPGLDRQDSREAAAVFRLLFSTRAWFHLTTDHEMTTDEAAHAVAWAMRLVIADLNARSKKRTR